MANDTIDLGKTYDPAAMDVAAKDSKKPKVSYPSVFITHDMGKDGSKLDGMPDEGDAIIHYKISSYKEDKKNNTCSCELDIMSIKPTGPKAKPKKDTAEDGLGAALDNIAKSKK